MKRVTEHPILGNAPERKTVHIYVDGTPYEAQEGEMIAAALLALGISTFRYTEHNHKPRGIYCGIGRCTDCIMTVDGVPNVRTCITPVHDGMHIQTQIGNGKWQEGNSND
ncbi:NADH dehydrogenase subunit G [uncultured Clostridium sp.]|uniref:(2Fe-2S)-binding protein n=1 Tax=Flintibacter hominis TaxID=2763048 RepID=A0A8J6M2E5_9FIRM|nr:MULTISPECIES: (2Fe-2S)-binding protein [Eubacteriales]MBC5721610.1 (2Fe-2S)-binding protein [Flintibacter hominis]MCU6704131.1 (2Fe-2S)-binding protein [Muriventricola aceti]SCH72842.1 NADH dehydrogenase subunit G [uncultured Clostridium sp.]SCJ69704.1 NADH dehydrogenase subunit G [uncultured Flavonifractor sp.]